MNGGAWEKVMANYNHMSGYDASHNSGFNGSYKEGGSKTDGVPFPSEKYYDYYETLDRDTACNGGKCIGQNTSEAFGWYGDYVYFVSTMYPWFYRSSDCYNATGAGVFSVGNTYGYAGREDSFRIVLTEG